MVFNHPHFFVGKPVETVSNPFLQAGPEKPFARFNIYLAYILWIVLHYKEFKVEGNKNKKTCESTNRKSEPLSFNFLLEAQSCLLFTC